MPMTTWLQSDEGKRVTSDDQLDSLLQEVRAITGQDWRVTELCIVKRLAWAKRVHVSYTIYFGVSGEFQIINHRLPHEWSINPCIPMEIASAYLYGILAGAHKP